MTLDRKEKDAVADLLISQFQEDDKKGSKPSYSRRPHFEMFLLNGRGSHCNDFTTYPLLGMSLVLIRPGQVFTWRDAKRLKGIRVLFNEKFFGLDAVSGLSELPSFPFLFSQSVPPVIRVPQSFQRDVQKISDKLLEEFCEKRLWSQDIIRLLLRILFRLIQRICEEHPEISSRLPGTSYLYHGFLIKLEQELPQFHTADKYAALLQSSLGELTRVTREACGKTPAVIIRERRLLQAKRLLLHSNLTLQQIAYELGFSDPSYFSKFFQKHTGQPPSAFKEKHQG